MRQKYIYVLVLLSMGFATHRARAATLETAAADTSVQLDIGAMHTQYHENLTPGDDENGPTAGFGVGAGALLPIRPGWNPDLYTALNYDFSAGNIHYGGHYIESGQPASATDNAVFNRIEAKIGLGYQIPGNGGELIGFLAGGYQAWNRNINQKGVIGTDEFYHSFLLGGGIKLDTPLSPTIVASVSGEMLALLGGGIALDNFHLNQSFGPSAAQRVTFGLDDALSGRLHIVASTFWQHFNYSGSRPQVYDFDYLIYEPLSTTTQFGGSIGVAYSF
jgi:hypothetical protein